jgi:hypothetical protein
MSRVSDDGPGQDNPDLSEGLSGGGVVTHDGSASSSPRPDTERDSVVITRCTKGEERA